MNVRIQTGKGVSGALRYVQGEGRDAKTGALKALAPGADSRAELLGGTGFGFEIATEAHAELARRVMEFAALNQASKTKKCEQDCVTIELNWARGEKAGNQEKTDAARAVLAALGMGNAMALVYAHHDEDYEHIHIVASKINPATGRAYDLAESWRKGSEWAEEYERQHGGVINTRRETANELRRAIRERDAERVLEALTKRRSTFTAKELERVVQKEIHWKVGATPAQKRTVELQRAEFVSAVLSHAGVVRLAEKFERPEPWMSAAGGLAALNGEHREGAARSYQRWSEANPEAAIKYDLADYVQYVQDKWAGQEHGRAPLGLRYTTRSVLEAEQHVLRAANGLVADGSHGLEVSDRARLLAAEKYRTITREQVRAFRHATGAEALALIDGQAGTGKSFTMAAIREAYEAAGHRVIGLAPTNKVAKNMANDGFGHAKTVHSELFALNNGRTQWNPKTVVMVDEAAMLDTKLMAMVTAHAHDAGAKLILVGDDRQLSSIDRGGMFGVLKDRHGAAELSEVKRQRKLDDRRASEMMAEGNFHDALGIYEDKGAINWASTQREARAELVEKWAKDSAAGRDKTRFVFAYTNEDVDQLNAALRAVRKERGELEWEDHALDTTHGRFDFSAGDRIQFTRTDKPAGIMNGAAGTILAIDGTHLSVMLDGAGGRAAQTINFDAASFGAFRLGYAGTIYKGQGDTLDQTYLYHSDHWRAAPSYVALTRHREDMALFVARSTAKDVTELARQVARQDETRAASQFHRLDPIGPVRPLNAAEILAEFAGADFAHTAERMEREGRSWPARQYNPMPRPPWPSLRERRPGYYQQDNDPPAGGRESAVPDPEPAISSIVPPSQQPSSTGADAEPLAADRLTARVQAMIEDLAHGEAAAAQVTQHDEIRYEPTPQATAEFRQAGRETAIPGGARREAAWQQPAFSDETMEADAWTAVFLPIPEQADRKLLETARFWAGHFQREPEGDRHELLAGNWEFYDPGPFRNPGTYNRDDKVAAATKRAAELDRILFAAELSAELSPDELAERVQRIIDDPIREADEHDPRILQALYVRREAEAQPVTADDMRGVESASDEGEEAGTSEEEQAIDSAVAGQEMTDDKQVQYSRWTGQLFGAAGRQVTGPARGGGRGRTRSR